MDRRTDPGIGDAVTTKTVTATKVEYRITGSLDSVQAMVAHIFKGYDARGYGTRVQSLQMNDIGQYVAVVSRHTSCD